MKYIFILIIITSIGVSSCKHDDAPAYSATVKAPLSVEFDNVAGSADLQLNTATYKNTAGENFTVSRVKYYVSNFVLTNINGTVYTVPQDSCYFLVDESDPSTHEPVVNVPEGEYKTLQFVVGVDSLRSTLNIANRTGVLDPRTSASDMYWDANNGYIFFKMEGTSPAISNSGNGFLYYIGGYGGSTTPTSNNLKKITLDLTARGTPKVKAGKDTNIHLFVDILQSLSGSTTMRFANTSMILSPQQGVPVAANYAAMFRHDHTEN